MSPCLPFSGIFTPSFVNSSFACSCVNFPDFFCSKIDFAFSFACSSKLANMSPRLPFSGIFTPNFVNSSFACSRVSFPDFSCSKIDFAFSFACSSNPANMSLRFSFSGSFTPSSCNCFFVSSIIVFTFCFVASSKSFFAVFVACSAFGVFVAANAGTPTPPMIPNDKAPAIAK
ncbi:Uncharacterised protein [Streptococcus pneumoniae]|nr:Uncharacterised protein [Streptococcus pneumoniae]